MVINDGFVILIIRMIPFEYYL